MQWSTMTDFMQDLSVMIIDEGQQHGTDREIATISLLRQQPLILWTGNAQQTPGGLARAAPNAKRSRQLLAKKHGLRSNRTYFMLSNLAEAMIKLLEDTANEGLTLAKNILARGEHILGNMWTGQLTQPTSCRGSQHAQHNPPWPGCPVPHSHIKRSSASPPTG